MRTTEVLHFGPAGALIAEVGDFLKGWHGNNGGDAGHICEV
jgi:hypothetical protein